MVAKRAARKPKRRANSLIRQTFFDRDGLEPSLLISASRQTLRIAAHARRFSIVASLLSPSEHSPQSLGCARATHEPGQHEDGDHVRKDLNELNWNRLPAEQADTLEPNLHRLGKAKQQAGNGRR